MSTRDPHWRIVRTDNPDQPWHAVFVGCNGKTLASTETYTRRERALRAARLINPDVTVVDRDERSPR